MSLEFCRESICITVEAANQATLRVAKLELLMATAGTVESSDYIVEPGGDAQAQTLKSELVVHCPGFKFDGGNCAGCLHESLLNNPRYSSIVSDDMFPDCISTGPAAK